MRKIKDLLKKAMRVIVNMFKYETESEDPVVIDDTVRIMSKKHVPVLSNTNLDKEPLVIFNELKLKIKTFGSMSSDVSLGYLRVREIFLTGIRLLESRSYNILLFPEFDSTYDLFKSLGMHMGLIYFYQKNRGRVDIDSYNPFSTTTNSIPMYFPHDYGEFRKRYIEIMGYDSKVVRNGVFYKFNSGIVNTPNEIAQIETAKFSFRLRAELCIRMFNELRIMEAMKNN